MYQIERQMTKDVSTNSKHHVANTTIGNGAFQYDLAAKLDLSYSLHFNNPNKFPIYLLNNYFWSCVSLYLNK